MMITPPHIAMTVWMRSLPESWGRRRGPILEGILHGIGPVIMLEEGLMLGLAVLLLGGADRDKLLKRIEQHLLKPRPPFLKASQGLLLKGK
jgi:hypothetical protein